MAGTPYMSKDYCSSVYLKKTTNLFIKTSNVEHKHAYTHMSTDNEGQVYKIRTRAIIRCIFIMMQDACMYLS